MFAGGEPHHQLAGVPGAAGRSRKAGGSLSGELRAGLSVSHRGRRAPQTGRQTSESGAVTELLSHHV